MSTNGNRIIIVTEDGRVVSVHGIEGAKAQVIDLDEGLSGEFDVQSDARVALAAGNLDRGEDGLSVLREYFPGLVDAEEDAKCISCGIELSNVEEEAGTGYCADCAPGAEEIPSCPKCGGPGVSLGRLGNKEHYRCRDCGWDFSE